jgi:DNA helicase II / ATP-dependent DNA helicase PcrA
VVTDKLKIVIAGPGAGKTHALSLEVLKSLPVIEPHRFCAVITYTNAATDEIRARISNEVKLQPNLFIGTIHSFLIRFIFEPFAHLLGISEVEKYYIDKAKLNYTPRNNFAGKAQEKNIAENLLKKGIVTYDQVLGQAYQIIESNPNIAKLLSNRLQFVFIDEYQDSRLLKHNLIKKIFQESKTEFYFIGDPLQSIFNFTYTFSQLKKEPQPKLFSETPMMDFLSNYTSNVSSNSLNYRSSSNIVNVINNFILKAEHKQTSVSGENNIPIYFIEGHDKAGILEAYQKLQERHKMEEIHTAACIKKGKEIRRNLILTGAWKTMADTCNQKGISELPRDNHKQSNHLIEISRVILGVLGLKKTEALTYCNNEIEYRKFCFEVLRLIKNSAEDKYNSSQIRNLFQTTFNCTIPSSSGEINIQDSLEHLRERKVISSSKDFYSAIHSSKGLEATSVLICAETEAELTKWLNFSSANTEMDDDFRMGYVGFSRARDMLCIACLKPLKNQESTNLLNLLNVKYSSEVLT